MLRDAKEQKYPGRQVVNRLKDLEEQFQKTQAMTDAEKEKKAKLRAMAKKWRFQSSFGQFSHFFRRYPDSKESFEKNLDNYNQNQKADMNILKRYSRALLEKYILSRGKGENYPKALSKLPIDIRVELAKIHVQYSGNKILNLYNLDAEKLSLLQEYTNEALMRALPYVPDEYLNQCIKDNDRDGLQYFFYQRFANTIYRHSVDSENSLRKLVWLGGELADSVKRFKIAMQEQEAYLKENGWRTPTEYMNLDEPKKYASDYLKKEFKEDDLVTFSHGGGYFHILGFLTGREQGYRLHELVGRGIQVQAMMKPPGSERDEYYAKKSINYFDIPAHVFASIKIKHLRYLNYYGGEADLRGELVDHVQNAVVRKF